MACVGAWVRACAVEAVCNKSNVNYSAGCPWGHPCMSVFRARVTAARVRCTVAEKGARAGRVRCTVAVRSARRMF